MAVTLIVYRYCMGMTIFQNAKLDILSLSMICSMDRTAHIFCYIVKYRYVKPYITVSKTIQNSFFFAKIFRPGGGGATPSKCDYR